MLPVTGQRHRSRNTMVVNNHHTVVSESQLNDPTSPINQKFLSGKEEGSIVLASGSSGNHLYLSNGELPESGWTIVGGGGAGGDPRSIVAIDGTSANSKIRVTRASGRSDDIELAPTIQNTPAYSLLINNQGFNTSEHAKMAKGDGDTKGGKITSMDSRVTLPPWLFDYGGGKLGGDYDTTTGDLYIAADSVEVTVQVAYNVGVHPDWPGFDNGKPVGNYTTRFNFEQKQPDGSWVVLGYKDVYHASYTGAHPNTTDMNHSTSNSAFVVTAPTAGWYRITFSVVEYGGDASIIPWIRFGAYTGEFYNPNSTSKHFFQIKGSIKSTAGGVAIPPVPKP